MTFCVPAVPTDAICINLQHIPCFWKIAKEFSIKLIANNFDSPNRHSDLGRELVFHFNHEDDPCRIAVRVSSLFLFVYSVLLSRSNSDYLYYTSTKHLHMKYYLQIILSSKDISSLLSALLY
jgi:hypothetical protein